MYNRWVKQYEKTVEESTFVKTTGIFRNHILPAMSDYKVEKITIDVCQKHVDEWSNKLKKFRTFKSYASKVLDFAIKRGYIQKNPFNHVETYASLKKKQESKEEKKENFYTREELIEFLSCFEKENNVKAYTLFRLLAFSGMRKGEALALKWKDISFKEVSTHGLRHTHCSLLFEAGAKIKEVQDRLGHSDIQITMNIYTHVTTKAKEDAIQKFEEYLNLFYRPHKFMITKLIRKGD